MGVLTQQQPSGSSLPGPTAASPGTAGQAALPSTGTATAALPLADDLLALALAAERRHHVAHFRAAVSMTVATQRWEEWRQPPDITRQEYGPGSILPGQIVWTTRDEKLEYNPVFDRYVRRPRPYLQYVPEPTAPSGLEVTDPHSPILFLGEELAAGRTFGITLAAPIRGWTAYRLSSRRTEDSPDDVDMWIDTESLAILRAERRSEVLGTATTIIYEDVEYDPPLPEGFLAPEPPGSATAVVQAQLRIETVTLAKARERATFPVLVPARLPAGYTLYRVSLIREGDAPFDAVGLVYRPGLMTIDEHKVKPAETFHPIGEKVQVGDSPAELIELSGGTQTLRWRHGEVEIRVTVAHGLPRSELLELAGSMR